MLITVVAFVVAWGIFAGLVITGACADGVGSAAKIVGRGQ